MGGAVRYVAVGDSVARGFRLGAPRPAGARPLHGPLLGLLSLFDRPGAGYPARVAEILGARGARVDLDTSLTSSGATSGTLWRTDGPAARLRRVFGSPADVVTVTVGANDVMRPWAPYILASAPLRLVAGRGRDLAPVLDPLAPPPEASAAALGRLRERLRALLEWLGGAGCPRVVVTGYYSGDGSEVVDRIFRAPVDAAIAAAAAGLPWVRFVPLEPVFARGGPSGRARLVSGGDGLHPSDAGQDAIARAVVAALDRAWPAAPAGVVCRPARPGRAPGTVDHRGRHAMSTTGPRPDGEPSEEELARDEREGRVRPGIVREDAPPEVREGEREE